MKIFLSDREAEILKLIISEYTTSEIASKLSLSCETIKTHRKHLLEKCSARNVAGLVRRAYESGIIANLYTNCKISFTASSTSDLK